MPDQAVWKPFRDFVIRIEQTGENRYRVRGRTHDNREATTTFESPFGDKDLKIFLLTVGQPRRTVRRGRVPQPVRETEVFGRALFDAALSGAVGQLFASARHDAFLGNYGLRVQLRLSGAPHLVNLPWEFLFDGRDFLALLPDTPVVRYLDLERPPRPMRVTPPLNMLVTISAPTDLQRLDVEEEREKLQEALQAMEPDKRPHIQFTPNAQLATLQRTLRHARLRGNPFHIWHYIGHGGYDPDQRSSFLVFTTRSGAPERVDGFQLGTLFGGYPEIRLAVLNACEGARSDTEDPFAGVAAALVEKGVPAVIGMQFEISDEVAARLSTEFYTALAEGLPVDAALTEARRAVFFMPNWLEWATPVLFMRTPDGQLFDLAEREVPREASADKKPPRGAPAVDDAALERLWIDASAAYYTDNWAEAVDRLERIVAARQSYRSAATRLETARRMLRCASAYDDGCRAMEQGDWRSAVALLSEVAEADADFRDVQRKLQEARRQARLAELYEEATLLSQAGHWQAVIRVFDRLHALTPDYPDPDDLQRRAADQIEAGERQAQAKRLYRDGIEAIDRGDWAAAEQALGGVEAIAPGFESTEALLQRVRRELQAAYPPRLVTYLAAEPEVIDEGGSLTWRLQVHNAGQADLRDVFVMRDRTAVEGPLSLAAGEARMFTFRSTFTAAGQKSRTMHVTGETERGVEVTSSVTATATVRSKPKRTTRARDRVSASISIEPETATVVAGRQLIWTVIVRNDGTVDLRRLTLERDSREIETFTLAPGQERRFTSQSRYTTPGVKEKVVSISGSAANGKRIFEADVGSVEVLPSESRRSTATPGTAPGTKLASAATFREYMKSLGRQHRSAPCPLCGVELSNFVKHYDKMHAGEPGPVPAGFSPSSASKSQKAPSPSAPAPTYRDRLKQFARDHRGEMIACPVCGVPVSTDNLLRHYDRQHPGAVGSQPVSGSAPAGRSSQRAQAPAQSPATAYREELKAAIKEFGPDDYVYCPLCETTLKASNLIRHYDKVHPGEYRT